MSDYICIDFGTSKLCVSITNDPDRITFDIEGDEFIPNAVYFGNVLFFGRTALSKGKQNPQFLLTHLKELLGLKFDDPEVKKIEREINQKIVRGDKDFCALEIPFEQPRIYKPGDILCSFLKFVKEKVQAQLKRTLDSILLGVPSSYNQLQRDAIREAMINAGFQYVSLLEETTAICCSYDIHLLPNELASILVVDCGGGSFDASVVDVSETHIDVRIMKGNPRLGGNNFTEVVLNLIYEKLNIIDEDLDISKLGIKTRAYLRDVAEQIKILLSREDKCDTEIAIDEKTFNIIISRAEFNAASKFLYNQCDEILKSVLEEAQDRDIKVKYLCLSGSSFCIPKLAKHVSKVVKLDAESTVAPPYAVVTGLKYFTMSDRFQQMMKSEYKERNHELFDSVVNREFEGPKPRMMDRELSQAEKAKFILPPESDDSEDEDIDRSINQFMQKEKKEDLSSRIPPALNCIFPNISNLSPFITISTSVDTSRTVRSIMMYDLSFRGLFRGKSDRMVLYRHNTYRGMESITKTIILNPKKSYRILYQGNALLTKDLVAIKKYYLHYDDKHPKDKSHKCIVSCSVLEDGTIDMKFFWEDTKEPIHYQAMDVSEKEANVIKRRNIMLCSRFGIFDSDGSRLTNYSQPQGNYKPKVLDPSFLSTIPEETTQSKFNSAKILSSPSPSFPTLPLPPQQTSPILMSSVEENIPYDMDSHPLPENLEDFEGLSHPEDRLYPNPPFPPSFPSSHDGQAEETSQGNSVLFDSSSSLRLSNIPIMTSPEPFDIFNMGLGNSMQSFQFVPMDASVENPPLLPQLNMSFSMQSSSNESQEEMHSFGTLPQFESVDEYIAVINRLKNQIRILLDGRCKLMQPEVSRSLGEINRWLMSANKQMKDSEEMLLKANTILAQLEKS